MTIWRPSAGVSKAATVPRAERLTPAADPPPATMTVDRDWRHGWSTTGERSATRMCRDLPCAWAIRDLITRRCTMTAELMDGTALAAALNAETASRAAKLTEVTGRPPCLATVLMGADPASVTYVTMKRNRCRKVGIESRSIELPAETT